MCGIAGFSGHFSQQFLQQAIRSQAHRGPDDEGIFFDAKRQIGLAHRRLSILDLSADGHQPMWDVTSQVAIVFNGEIYNFRELKKNLQQQGVIFRSRSDTEVILYCYLADPEHFLSQLNGVFALAIWDQRRQTLLLARDGLGVKPLYYAQTTKGWVFASELKALLYEPSVDRALDHQALGSYVRYLWCPTPYTPLKSIKKLPPGAVVILREGKIVSQQFFYQLPLPQPALSNSTELNSTDLNSTHFNPVPLNVDQAIQQVRSGLQAAVTRQLIADVPVGAFLSGGLDSSAIAYFAQQANPDRRLSCFTIDFSTPGADQEGMVEDLPYARQVAKHLGIDLQVVTAGPEMLDDLEKAIYFLDEPQADPAILHVHKISQLAAQSGVKVLLSGAGGDDLFTGYRRHRALQLEAYWQWLPATVRTCIAEGAKHLPTSSSLLRKLRKAMQYAGLPADERLQSYFYWLPPDVLPTLSAYSLLPSLNDLPKGTARLDQMLRLEMKHFLVDHNLNYTDKMSMASGVEVRVPFLDLPLVALVARLPLRLKQKNGCGKWILKKAMEPYLPHSIIYRPKTGFGAPLRYWLQHHLRPMVDDLLSGPVLEQRGIFPAASVNEMLQRTLKGQADFAYPLFSLMCIELWCRRFLDKP